MKTIVTHKQRDIAEICEILKKTSTYSFPNLPHYRYRKTNQHRKTLIRLGLIKKSGQDGVTTNYIVTDLFKQFVEYSKENKECLGVVRWVKSIKNVDA